MKLFKDRLIWAMQRKSEREHTDISEADVMRATGASAASVNYWVTGKNAAGAKNCRKLAKYLDVDAIWLESGEGNYVIPTIDADTQTILGDVRIPQYIDMGGSMGQGVLLRDQPGEIHSW